MCGEAAADAKLIPLFLSFGLDEFSVSPSLLLATRKHIGDWDKSHADQITAKAMECACTEEIQALLDTI